MRKTETMRRLTYILLAVLVLCSACQMRLAPTDEEAQHRMEVQRYDRLEYRYLATGDFSALQQMSTEYPMETRTLIENVLQLGEATDPNINRTLLKFYQDTTLQAIIADAEAKYANMDTLNRRLADAFERLQKAIPSLRVPMVYAQLTSLDQSIVVGNHSVGISLDKYLGADYPAYARFGFNEAQRAQMTRDYILPDVLSYYLISLYPLRDFESRPQHDRDLYIAKVQWVANQAMASAFYHSPHVKAVERYMRHNPQTTYEQLLTMTDYSVFQLK